jgi:glucose/arabinose dehydrogenase
MSREVVWEGLKRPHGLAFDPKHPRMLYVAQEDKITRWDSSSQDNPSEKIADLPSGGRHFTRSLAFGPNGRLYVSIGSTCDVCREKNPENGSIISMNPDGSDRRMEATGLRNAVFLQFISVGPGSFLYATEMGRDYLGDHLPPDEINDISTDGKVRDYGWPICYGQRVHDIAFDKNQYVRDPCADTYAPEIELPAHVAPLGLAQLPDDSLLVAYHGSWNSSVPVGYKVVRLTLPAFGPVQSEDFLTGFLKDGSALGRPVDVLPMPDGSVLVSDDKAGAIWRVAPVR